MMMSGVKLIQGLRSIVRHDLDAHFGCARAIRKTLYMAIRPEGETIAHDG